MLDLHRERRGESDSMAATLRLPWPANISLDRRPPGEIEAGNSLLDGIREVLRRRVRLFCHHVIFAQRGLEWTPEPLRQSGIVVHRVRTFVAIDRRLARRAGRF